MIKKIIFFLSALLIIEGCTITPTISHTAAAERQKMEWSMKFPAPKYLTATATGSTEMNARKSALAGLSSIFDSQVISKTGNKIESHVNTRKQETIKRQSFRDIRILSSVQLKGAKIGAVWFDTTNKLYYTIAILDRNMAKTNWENDLRNIDTKSIAVLEALGSQKSYLSRLQSLKKIQKQWLEYEVIISRLRVLGFSRSSTTYKKIQNALKKQALLRANILIYIDGGKKKEARFVVIEISKNLGDSGYAITDNEANANIILRGDVTVSPVKLNNDSFKFARATASFTIFDKETNLVVGKISENKRVGHLNLSEASHNALQQVSNIVSKQLIAYFEW